MMYMKDRAWLRRSARGSADLLSSRCQDNGLRKDGSTTHDEGSGETKGGNGETSRAA